MALDRDIFTEAARLTAAGEPFVLVTVITTKGSSPRDAGAKMIWRPAPHAMSGTVGGGQFEMLVAEAAERVFASRSCAMEKFVLGAEAEQCCGGVMEVFLEYCGTRQRLVIFGAGHVAKELVDVLRGSPLEVVVVDDRPEWNSGERFPPELVSPASRMLQWDVGIKAAREHPGRTLACVMTCSHETDFELLRGLLKTNDEGTGFSEPKPVARDNVPAFVGLIGSRSKRACLFGRLVASGLDEARVARVQCPIGVGDTGKEPRMVAVSMAAGLLLEAKRMERARTGGLSAQGVAGEPHRPVARSRGE
ncbi:MAG TPA: xanthine dehydrogenase accessory protein XdhC [Phycisphaerales bacterium]|nr:xanthine dehydrogenase accessory protein XdhC [Phycisphaerales bacterium]